MNNILINSFIEDNDYIYYWIITTIFIIYTMMIIIANNNYYQYYLGKAVLKKDYTVEFVVDYDDIDIITKNNNIIIKENSISYQVKSVNDVVDGNVIYYNVILSLEHNTIDMKENSYLNFKIVISKCSVFDLLVNVLRGNNN